MSDRDRNDQQPTSDTPEPQDIQIGDLKQDDVSKENASETKGGGMAYEDEAGWGGFDNT
jgi:hypothetical protein